VIGSVSGTDSEYAVHKMMMLSEKVRPCDRRKRPAVVHAPTAGPRTTRVGARNARIVASSSSSSPRQRRHRVVPTPAVDLSAESSSVTSVGVNSTHKPSFISSLKTGINKQPLSNLCDLIFIFRQMNGVNGGDAVFVRCVSVCMSLRSRLVNQTSLKQFKIRTSNLTCVFPETVRT